MRRIETIATVTDDGTLMIPVPADVTPGAHAVIVEIDERPIAPVHRTATNWLTFLQETAARGEAILSVPCKVTTKYATNSHDLSPRH